MWISVGPGQQEVHSEKLYYIMSNISMGLCKTVISSLLTHLGYCSLALSHGYQTSRQAYSTNNSDLRKCFTKHSEWFHFKYARWARYVYPPIFEIQHIRSIHLGLQWLKLHKIIGFPTVPYQLACICFRFMLCDFCSPYEKRLKMILFSKWECRLKYRNTWLIRLWYSSNDKL